MGAKPPERLLIPHSALAQPVRPRRGGNHGGPRRSKVKHRDIGARNADRGALALSPCPLCRELDALERSKGKLEGELYLSGSAVAKAALCVRIRELEAGSTARLRAHPKCAAYGILVGPGHVIHSPVRVRGMLFCPACPKLASAEWRRQHGISGLLDEEE